MKNEKTKKENVDKEKTKRRRKISQRTEGNALYQ